MSTDRRTNGSRPAYSRRQFMKLGALGAAGAGLVLAGCGGGSGGQTQSNAAKPTSKKESGTLTMWTWAGAAGYKAGLEAVIKAYPKEFGG